MSPILGIIASQNYPRITNSYESIQTVTVGSGGAASISFTSIPSTFTHLQIRGIARQNGGTDTQNWWRFNGDTGSNYSTHALYGYGSGSAQSLSYLSTYITSGAVGSPVAANIFNVYVADILDYTNTNKYTTARILSGNDQNGGGYIWFSSGAWRNTNAITSIEITNNGSNNFVEHSQFALYGIKGA